MEILVRAFAAGLSDSHIATIAFLVSRASLDGTIPLTTGQIAQARGLTWQGARKQLRKLVEVGLIEGFDQGMREDGGRASHTWKLKDRATDALPGEAVRPPLTVVPELEWLDPPNQATKSPAHTMLLKPKVEEVTTVTSSLVEPVRLDSSTISEAELAIARLVKDELDKGRQSWDLTEIAGKAWTEYVPPGDVNRGNRFLAAYWLAATGSSEDWDWKRGGRLARQYGKLALYGVAEALKKETGNPFNYATAVAQRAAAAMAKEAPVANRLSP